MLATMLLGVALSVQWAEAGAPATKVIWLLTLAFPDSAVTVLVSALLLASVVA